MLQHQIFSVVHPGVAFAAGNTILAWFAGELAFIANFIGLILVKTADTLNKKPTHKIGQYYPALIRDFLIKSDPLEIDAYFKFSAGILGFVGMVVGITSSSLIAVISSTVLILYGVGDYMFANMKHRTKKTMPKSALMRILTEPNLYSAIALLCLTLIAGSYADLNNTFASLDQFMKNLPIYVNVPMSIVIMAVAIKHGFKGIYIMPSLKALWLFNISTTINLVCSYHTPLIIPAFAFFIIAEFGLMHNIIKYELANQQNKPHSA